MVIPRARDHNIAWRTRHNLNLDHLLNVIPGPANLFAGDVNHPDNIIFDINPNPNGGTGVSATGFGHPTCLNNPPSARLPLQACGGNRPSQRTVSLCEGAGDLIIVRLYSHLDTMLRMPRFLDCSSLS